MDTVDDSKKEPREAESEPQEGPFFDEVVRRMLNTPPKPKKGKLAEGQRKGTYDESADD